MYIVRKHLGRPSAVHRKRGARLSNLTWFRSTVTVSPKTSTCTIKSTCHWPDCVAQVLLIPMNLIVQNQLKWLMTVQAPNTMRFHNYHHVPHYSYFSAVDSDNEPECWTTYGIDEDVQYPIQMMLWLLLQSHLDSVKDNCRSLIVGCNLWLTSMLSAKWTHVERC